MSPAFSDVETDPQVSSQPGKAWNSNSSPISLVRHQKIQVEILAPSFCSKYSASISSKWGKQYVPFRSVSGISYDKPLDITGPHNGSRGKGRYRPSRGRARHTLSCPRPGALAEQSPFLQARPFPLPHPGTPILINPIKNPACLSHHPLHKTIMMEQNNVKPPARPPAGMGIV